MKSCNFHRIAQRSSKNSMTLSSFSMTFQAWKMVFLNSMTFHDQGAPCNKHLTGDGTCKYKFAVKQ